MCENRKEGKGRREYLATQKIPSCIQNKITKGTTKKHYTDNSFPHKNTTKFVQQPLQVLHLSGFNCHSPEEMTLKYEQYTYMTGTLKQNQRLECVLYQVSKESHYQTAASGFLQEE